MKKFCLSLAFLLVFLNPYQSFGKGPIKQNNTEQTSSKSKLPEFDSDGRRYMQGPVPSGLLERVHIFSKTIGVVGDGTRLFDSVIDAPICISMPGNLNVISGNFLNCGLCVDFTHPVVTDTQLINNTCTGRLTNRPDIFGM